MDLILVLIMVVVAVGGSMAVVGYVMFRAGYDAGYIDGHNNAVDRTYNEVSRSMRGRIAP